MSTGIINPTQRSSHSPSPVMHSCLLNIPEEMLYAILRLLSFKARVALSQTCRRLRSSALAHQSLWQALPNVGRVSRLRTLEPFVEHSGNLGFDLKVEVTQFGHVSKLCSWLKPRFHRIRTLHILFDKDYKSNAVATLVLHLTLAAPAPLLEDLCIAGPYAKPPFLGTLRRDVLGGVVASKLRRVNLSAFKLNARCPALQRVTTVVATVAALAPKADPAANRRVHRLFPAIEHLQLEGVHAGADITIGSKHAPISRLPVLDAPLLSLSLGWYYASNSEDFDAAAWLERSIQHVHEVKLDVRQGGLSVPDAILSSILDQACALHIDTWFADNGTLKLSLRGAARRRSAFVNVAQAEALLKKFIQQPRRLQLNTLVLSADALSLSVMKNASASGSWAALPHLRTLKLDLKWYCVGEDGWFVSPETLASLDPMPNIAVLRVGVSSSPRNYGHAPRAIDGRCILQLIERALPNVESVVVSVERDLLSNYELLSGVKGFELGKTPAF